MCGCLRIILQFKKHIGIFAQGTNPKKNQRHVRFLERPTRGRHLRNPGWSIVAVLIGYLFGSKGGFIPVLGTTSFPPSSILPLSLHGSSGPVKSYIFHNKRSVCFLHDGLRSTEPNAKGCVGLADNGSILLFRGTKVCKSNHKTITRYFIKNKKKD